ncbi:hypothetical protein NKG94_08330 [Micromonospora sp. M12]
MALALVVAALVTLPLGIVDGGAVLLDPPVLALGAALAVLASGCHTRWSCWRCGACPPPPSRC